MCGVQGLSRRCGPGQEKGRGELGEQLLAAPGGARCAGLRAGAECSVLPLRFGREWVRRIGGGRLRRSFPGVSVVCARQVRRRVEVPLGAEKLLNNDGHQQVPWPRRAEGMVLVVGCHCSCIVEYGLDW